jgi:hypothetical protein
VTRKQGNHKNGTTDCSSDQKKGRWNRKKEMECSSDPKKRWKGESWMAAVTRKKVYEPEKRRRNAVVTRIRVDGIGSHVLQL